MSGALSFTPIQVPDFGASLARAQGMQANRLAMLAQQRQMDQEDALNAAIQQNSGALGSADPNARLNALTALASSGPRGLQVALPLITALRQEQDFFGGPGQGGATASPGAPAAMPAPGGSSGGGLSPVAERLIPVAHRADNPQVALDPGNLRDRLASGLGLSGAQAAGVVSGLTMESGLRPGIVRPGGADYGLAQWVGPRRDALFRFAQQAGRPAYDPETQIAFLQQEMQQNPRLMERLRGARSATEAGHIFHDFLAGGAPEFERLRGWHASRAEQIASAQAGGGLLVGGAAPDAPRAIPTADGGTAPAAARGGPVTEDGLPNVPGFDMALVRRAMTLPNNPTASAYLQRYMQVAQLMQRGEPPAPVEVADPSSPTGRRLVQRSQAYGQPAPAPQGAQGTQTERDQQRYIELDERRASLNPREQQELALIERRLTMPQTIAAPDGSIRTIQPPPLPRQGGAPGTIPTAASDPGAPSGAADAQPVNAPRTQTTPTPGGQTVTTVQEPRMAPDASTRAILENVNGLRQARQALALIQARPESVGAWQGAANMLPADALNRIDPGGAEARAAMAAIGATRVHDLSGAAVTVSEFPRLRPFIPQVGDDPRTVQTKLTRFIQEYESILRDQYRSYGPENNFRAMPQVEEILAPPPAQSAGPGGRGSAEPPPRLPAPPPGFRIVR